MSAHGDRLHPADVAAIAAAVADLLAGRERPVKVRLADAEEIARAYGVSASYVRANAARLGAVRVGEPGKRARLRFDPEIVAECWGSGDGGKRSGRPKREVMPSSTKRSDRPASGT